MIRAYSVEGDRVKTTNLPVFDALLIGQRELVTFQELIPGTIRVFLIATICSWSRKVAIPLFMHFNNLFYSLPIAMYLNRSHPVMSPSEGFLGGLFMMSRSGGLKPRAVAGSPSVTRFTHSSCTGISASGRPSAAVRKIETT